MEKTVLSDDGKEAVAGRGLIDILGGRNVGPKVTLGQHHHHLLLIMGTLLSFPTSSGPLTYPQLP